MSKNKYDHIKYSDLRQLYAERCSYMGIEKPKIPRTREGLVTMLRASDTLGVPQDRDTDPMDSIKAAVVKILSAGITESKRTDKPLATLIYS
jgi:hypothetical protein